MPIIRGLTLWRPWDIAMRELGKGVENRDWTPPEYLVGQLVALHSGQHWDEAGAQTIAEVTGRKELEDRACPAGYITCVGVLVGYVEVDEWTGLPLNPAVVTPDQDQWLFGRYGWLIPDRVAIEPVACKGRQGLWALPPDVERLVLERYEAARTARRTT